MAVLTTPVEPFRQLGTRPVGFLVVVVGAFLLADAFSRRDGRWKSATSVC